LNIYNSKTTGPKFDFHVSKYLENYSALEWKIKTQWCHSKK